MSGVAFEIKIDDREVKRALDHLLSRLADPTPAFRSIGEALLTTTKQRFRDEEDPEGKRWAENSPITLARYLARRGAKAAAKKRY